MSVFQDVLFSVENDHGHIVLNRPHALNALTIQMIDALLAQLNIWEKALNVKAIIISGVGEKAFCAGGDVKALREAKLRGHLDLLEDFYRREYTLNYRLATYKKPIIAVMDGIVMGGGAGIALHCSHPIATHKTIFSMPECRIGLFPDVGAAHFLNRCSPALAQALALTGLALRGPGVVRLGLVRYFVGSGRVKEISIDKLDELNLPVEVAGIEQMLPHIEAVFSLKTLDEIITVLNARRDVWAIETLRVLKSYSPKSLRVTFSHIARSRGQELKDVLKNDFRIVQHFMKEADFFEGIRAYLIDKDAKPQWQPAAIESVSQAAVSTYDEPLIGIEDWVPPNL